MSAAEPHHPGSDLRTRQKELIARIRRADHAAPAELYDETSGQVFGLVETCRAETGSRHNIGYSRIAALLLILSSARDEVEI